MALTVRRSFSNQGRLYSIRQSEGDIVSLFEIPSDSYLKKIIKFAPLVTSNWTWDNERSVVFGAVLNTGILQIFDLHTRKALIKINAKFNNNFPNVLWANFLFSPAGDLVLFMQTKDLGLCFKILTGDCKDLTLKPVEKISMQLGFCKPVVFQDWLLVPDEKRGLVQLRLASSGVEEVNPDGMLISQLIPKKDEFGMITVIRATGTHVVVIYESGHILVYDIKQAIVTEDYDISQHFDRLSGDQPFPLECTVSTMVDEYCQLIISLGGVNKPSLLLMNLIFNESGKTELSLEEIIEGIDGSNGIAMSQDRTDIIVLSGAGGKVEVMAFPMFQHLIPLPLQERDVKQLMFYRRPYENDKLFLLCATDKNLTCWNLAAMMKGCY